MQSDASSARDVWRLWAGVALITAVGFWVAWRYAPPPPPRDLVLATGSETGAYHAFGLRYREALQRDGIELELRPTAGSVENLLLLVSGEVDLAFVQGGTVPDPAGASVGASAARGDEQAPPYVGLASLYYEPLWIFHRAELTVGRVAELAGRRVQIGPEGSGTRAVALTLLEANGISGERAELGALPTDQAIDALLQGEQDALFMVAGAQSEALRRLLAEEGRSLRLLDVTHHEAYARNFHFLSPLVLPEGALDLGANRPDRDVHLLAPTAALVGRAGLHDALPALFIEAARTIHTHGGLFEAAGEFPSPRGLEVPLSKAAAQYFRDGPSFLYRVLPFSIAAMIDRLKILLLPLITLLFPLFKLTPPIYRWRSRSKIYRWYKQIRQADREIAAVAPGGDLAPLVARLQQVQREIEGVRVPPSYMGEYYTLRAHLDWVLRRARR